MGNCKYEGAWSKPRGHHEPDQVTETIHTYNKEHLESRMLECKNNVPDRKDGKCDKGVQEVWPEHTWSE